MIEYIKVKRGITPDEAIEVIETAFPKTIGLCFHHTILKRLCSRDENITFDYDAIHSVIEINFRND